MDFGSPASIISGLLIGLIGMVLFMYGRKQQEPAPLIAGVVLCAFPYFVASVILMWVITGLTLGGLYFVTRGS